MAKSKITIDFQAIAEIQQNDVIEIHLNYPGGNVNMIERFALNLQSPRPNQWTNIATFGGFGGGRNNEQARLYYESLVADYSGNGLVTFDLLGSKVIIEAVHECQMPTDCVNYEIGASPSTVFTVNYRKCNGEWAVFSVDGGDSGAICAIRGSVSTQSGSGEIFNNGDCTPGVWFGAHTFEVIRTVSTDKIIILLENNDCTGVGPPQDADVVFSEADSDPCNLIKACFTTVNLLVKLGTIDEKLTEYSLNYVANRTGVIFNLGQWRTILVNIETDGGCPNLFPVTGDDAIDFTFSSGAWNPANLHPYDTQYFLRNNQVARTISFKIKYDAYVSTSTNSVYDLFIMKKDLADNVIEWRHIGGNQGLNVGIFDYSIDYEGTMSLNVGDQLMLVQHAVGNAGGGASSTINYIEFDNFEFSVSCVEDNTVPNSDNPICLDIPRGQDYTLEGYDVNEVFFSETFTPPPKLSVNDISIIWVNNPTGSIVTIEHITGLNLMYNIDGGAWQILNMFNLLPDTSYTLNVKDEYGCEIAIAFTIDDEYYNEPQQVIRRSCNSLHELNVGKYLNLCGKQYTMKIGFICNVQPNTVKIFKHVQMILNTNYAIKNICITTSREQERFVPGTHMVYRIREGMHSVPLKNPEEFDDLRGSWAYMEIEIESIDNKKVDLFSVITHLRKSTI